MSERALVISAGGGIGDALLATPVARALGSRFAHVDMLVMASQRDTVAHAPAVGKVLVDEGSLLSMAAALRDGRYAAAITTWATLRTTLLPLLAGIPVRVGQARRLYSPLFTRRVTIRSELGDRTTHWTEVLLDYARALGCNGAAQPQFEVAPGDVEQARAVLADVGARRFVILHPTRGISHARDRWPREGFVALARALASRCEATVLVSGSLPDAPIADEIAGASGARSIAGRTAIGTFAALARRRWRWSRWTADRCTSPPPSARRRSVSLPCDPTSPAAGRRSARGPRPCAARIRARWPTARRRAPIFRASVTCRRRKFLPRSIGCG